jgi:hypothetical protein
MKIAFVLLALVSLYAADLHLGKPLTVKAPTAIHKIAATPDQYVGKTVQVKGKITEVCQMMGCWMQLVDSATGSTIRIKVNDGQIVFPKEGIGRIAIAEGKLTRIQLTKEQAVAWARHEAEENNRKFDPETVKGPATIYQVQGAGAVILD